MASVELIFDMDEARVTVNAEYNGMWEEWEVEVVAADLFDDEGNFLRTIEGEEAEAFHHRNFWLIEALTEKAYDKKFGGEE